MQIKKPIFRVPVTEIDERVKVMADPKFVPFDEIRADFVMKSAA